MSESHVRAPITSKRYDGLGNDRRYGKCWDYRKKHGVERPTDEEVERVRVLALSKAKMAKGIREGCANFSRQENTGQYITGFGADWAVTQLYLLPPCNSVLLPSLVCRPDLKTYPACTSVLNNSLGHAAS